MTELSDELSAQKFYEDYIQDNEVFSGMPHECWDFVKANAQEIYDEALVIRGDEWEVTEVAVRRVLRKHGLDGESW